MNRFKFMIIALLVAINAIAEQTVVGDYILGSIHTTNDLQILCNDGYTSAFDLSTANPAWVAYKVSKVDKFVWYPRSEFRTDPDALVKVDPGDYSYSGYDRGHCAPNFAIMKNYGKKAQDQTFYMSNMMPQAPRLNRGVWKQLEQKIANDYSWKYGELYVLCGPIYDSEECKWIRNKIKVPTHCYMIVARVDSSNTNEFDSISFIFPNENGLKELSSYTNSVDKIEELTGIDFFSNYDLNIQSNLESRVNKMW